MARRTLGTLDAPSQVSRACRPQPCSKGQCSAPSSASTTLQACLPEQRHIGILISGNLNSIMRQKVMFLQNAPKKSAVSVLESYLAGMIGIRTPCKAQEPNVNCTPPGRRYPLRDISESCPGHVCLRGAAHLAHASWCSLSECQALHLIAAVCTADQNQHRALQLCRSRL